jgi:hypothetical protein
MGERIITQFVCYVPPHGLNYKKMIEMTGYEEFGFLGRELSHVHDYPYLSGWRQNLCDWHVVCR